VTRIIIRGMPVRAAYIAALRKQLPSAELCIDRTRNGMDTFVAAMRMAGDDPAVHMEDDVVLCHDFVTRLEVEIAARPDNVVQFFSMRKEDETVGSRFDNRFMMTQCFYLPAGLSRAVAEFYPGWPRLAKDPTGFDLMLGEFLQSQHMKYWIVIPNLVDHLPLKSLISKGRSTKRQSKTFGKEAAA
jgi:hypothetical protein